MEDCDRINFLFTQDIMQKQLVQLTFSNWWQVCRRPTWRPGYPKLGYGIPLYQLFLWMQWPMAISDVVLWGCKLSWETVQGTSPPASKDRTARSKHWELEEFWHLMVCQRNCKFVCSCRQVHINDSKICCRSPWNSASQLQSPTEVIWLHIFINFLIRESWFYFLHGCS